MMMPLLDRQCKAPNPPCDRIVLSCLIPINMFHIWINHALFVLDRLNGTAIDTIECFRRLPVVYLTLRVIFGIAYTLAASIACFGLVAVYVVLFAPYAPLAVAVFCRDRDEIMEEYKEVLKSHDNNPPNARETIAESDDGCSSCKGKMLDGEVIEMMIDSSNDFGDETYAIIHYSHQGSAYKTSFHVSSFEDQCLCGNVGAKVSMIVLHDSPLSGRLVKVVTTYKSEFQAACCLAPIASAAAIAAYSYLIVLCARIPTSQTKAWLIIVLSMAAWTIPATAILICVCRKSERDKFLNCCEFVSEETLEEEHRERDTVDLGIQATSTSASDEL